MRYAVPSTSDESDASVPHAPQQQAAVMLMQIIKKPDNGLLAALLGVAIGVSTLHSGNKTIFCSVLEAIFCDPLCNSLSDE